ncbi:MAG: type I glyceraldehyde-3-phosphate dehydrogenase [Alphaproteobacteria bacterium]|nr:MAG: type I glyceraldehyde-3-phosphate dehydrogenase [Alphaproteobacteria bacterium]
MTCKVAINGFGRMGRLALRAAFDHLEFGPKFGLEFEFVLINDNMGTSETAAHLLEFDSIHGRWDKAIEYNTDGIFIEGHFIPVTSAARIEDMHLNGADLVLESTGAFRNMAQLSKYLELGAAKVIVAAPIKEGALNIVMGVNDHLYDPAVNHIVSNASCTTNCLAPVVKVMHEQLGIKHGSITTIHDVTNTQVVVDAPHKDLRRARSCLASLIPTSTGSATAITLIYPELKGKLNGIAVRVPLLNASLTDCVFEVKRKTTAQEVNGLFAEASQTYLKNILGYETRPLVSVDYTNDPRSAIIDGPSTMVVNDTQVKILAWYDNEWAYVCRMVELAQKMASTL